jgi:hypothetical protein
MKTGCVLRGTGIDSGFSRGEGPGMGLTPGVRRPLLLMLLFLA